MKESRNSQDFMFDGKTLTDLWYFQNDFRQYIDGEIEVNLSVTYVRFGLLAGDDDSSMVEVTMQYTPTDIQPGTVTLKLGNSFYMCSFIDVAALVGKGFTQLTFYINSHVF